MAEPQKGILIIFRPNWLVQGITDQVYQREKTKLTESRDRSIVWGNNNSTLRNPHGQKFDETRGVRRGVGRSLYIDGEVLHSARAIDGRDCEALVIETSYP